MDQSAYMRKRLCEAPRAQNLVEKLCCVKILHIHCKKNLGSQEMEERHMCIHEIITKQKKKTIK